MESKTLEQRMTELERQLADLRQAVTNGASEKDWQSTIGMFGDDPIMKSIFDRALEYREKDRKRARQRLAKSRRAKR